MKALFLDCFAGVSGPMLIGALVDLGVKPSALEWELSKLDLGDFHMHFERERRQNIEGIHFGIHAGATHVHEAEEAHDHDHHEHSHDHECDHGHDHEHGHEGHSHSHGEDEAEHAHSHVHEHHYHHHYIDDDDGLPPDLDHGSEVPSSEHHAEGRSLTDIRALIDASELSLFVKGRALAVYARIANARAKLGGADAQSFPMGDAGELAAIADVICTCVGIETLGVEKIFVSNLHDGHGVSEGEHGVEPIPSAATLEILRGLPLGQIDESHPLITPTGAAIVAEAGAAFGPMPKLKIDKIGYGIGPLDLVSRPHVLRAVFGDLVAE